MSERYWQRIVDKMLSNFQKGDCRLSARCRLDVRKLSSRNLYYSSKYCGIKLHSLFLKKTPDPQLLSFWTEQQNKQGVIFIRTTSHQHRHIASKSTLVPTCSSLFAELISFLSSFKSFTLFIRVNFQRRDGLGPALLIQGHIYEKCTARSHTFVWVRKKINK